MAWKTIGSQKIGQYPFPVPAAQARTRGAEILRRSVTEKISLVPRKSFGDLLRYPVCRRMRRHIDLDQLSPSQPNNDEGVEQAKANGRNDEQIDGCNVRHMIAKERAPALAERRVVPVLGHVLGHRRLRHREPELEQFAMNVRRAPERVLETHEPDQCPQLG